MSNDLLVLEQTLQTLEPKFAEVLSSTSVPSERIIRTVMISVEKTPKLLQCNRQSVLNSAMSAACLGIEVDGVTGQGFLIPFGNTCQLVIGYKGYNTMAARAGITLRSGVVREDDQFEYDPANGLIRHIPKIGGELSRRIIAAWAVAASKDRPQIVKVLSADELLAVKNKSPGAKKNESPWNDPNIGYPAMCEKSAKRRLARDLPLTIMTIAARMDEALEEQGQTSYVTPERGLIIDGEAVDVKTPVQTDQPVLTEKTAPTILGSDGSVREYPDIDKWQTQIAMMMSKMPDSQTVVAFRDRMQPVFDALREQYADRVATIEATLATLIDELTGAGM